MQLDTFLLHSLSRETWSKESNWIGYVATSSDVATTTAGRREIYVVWRGTIRDLEWINVLGDGQERIEKILPSDDGDGDGDEDRRTQVMTGWYRIYTSDDPRSRFNKASARDQLIVYLREAMERYNGEKLSIVFIGHSLGGALATLSAFDMAVNVAGDVPICAVVFGCPQVGNGTFKTRVEEQANLKILHVKNVVDLVPHYPSVLLGYTYVGDEFEVDTRKSPHLKDSMNPDDWHNLQALLHAVAGWNGRDGVFELRVKRSIALVNKSSDYLVDEMLIPASWWVESNRGMVLTDDGQWVPKPSTDEDVPVPPPQFL
jgi:pimeloyl-ACP methyl ester carboxylesterase